MIAPPRCAQRDNLRRQDGQAEGIGVTGASRGEPDVLKREEVRLRRFLLILGPVFAALAISYVLQGILPGKDKGSEFPFVANSLAKDGMFAALCIVAAADVRRHMWAVQVVIGAHVLLISGLLISLWLGNDASVSGSFAAPFGLELPDAKTIFWVWLVLAVLVTGALAWCQRAAARARYELRYLAPHQHRTLMALAEVLVLGDEESVTAEEVAASVDDYLWSFPAEAKRNAKLALTALWVYPMLRLRPPFPVMSAERRIDFIERCFIADVAERRLPGFLRKLVQSMLFGAQQLTFIGYYSDPRAAAETGYVPFSERHDGGLPKDLAERPYPPLRVRSPAEIDTERVTADVVIAGSGAAGAILANRLAEQGREVLVLERGRHVDPSEFTEDERAQFANLYADGGMQMSTDARFQVLQGKCVGGSTVVNNAVCFELPDHVLERWNDGNGLNAGLDEDGVAAAFGRLREFMPIARMDSRGLLAGGARKFRDGVKALGLDRDGDFDAVEANMPACLGSGYCNIGCPFGRKLSALDYTLPKAQDEFGDGVQIYSECGVERVAARNGSTAEVECRLSDGRRLRVGANTVVLSAGTLASSLILQRSNLGGPNVGRNLSWNLGAPLTAEYDEKLDAYAGVQISHYLRPPGDDGLILETWFNPVGAQALFMPGWFRDHFRNMRRYDRMASTGSVVGTRPGGTVKLNWRGRMKLDYEPHPDDLRRLVSGLKLAGRIHLAAGAKKVMASTFRYLTYSAPEELDNLDAQVRDNTDITLHTSHPQGGNAISADAAKGVVDPDFAVRGAPGVYVCDASVFPAAITVNPQMTVMAVAEYAAERIQ
jgi:choline dehydrogenase-like flavoprotein